MRGTRWLVLGVGTVMLTGCQLYWLKPGADMAAFSADHTACVRHGGAPPGADTVMVNLDLYRFCLRSRGWQRETGSKFENPPGFFRGQENEGPVRIGDVPAQVPTSVRR